MKRIGIIIDGGDAPGLNAVIRAVVKTAIYEYGCEVFGIKDCYDGFINENGIIPLGTEDVRGIITRGGFNRVPALHAGQAVDISLEEIVATPRRVDLTGDAVITARGMGIAFGDE